MMSPRRALAKLPPAPPGAPNVLLVVLDTVRAMNLSLYGYPRPTTPRLERLAGRGVRFELAFATAPWTLPSHASMFTGRYPYELSAGWDDPLDATYPTLADLFGARGYLTAAFVANTRYCSWESGLDRGFIHYENYLVSPGQIVLSSSLGRTIANNQRLRRLIGNYEVLGRKTAPKVNADFLRWLSRKGRRPFFVFLNYMEAHYPYLPPPPFDTKFGPRRLRLNPWLEHGWKWTPEEVQTELDAYDGSISYLDHHLGLLLDELERRGVLGNTLTIIVSDHGEQFGEHGVMRHGNTLYLPVLHVPLLILLPSRVPEGASVREPVTLRDLPATLLDLLGIEGGPRFPGSSLARFWAGGSTRAPEASPLLSEVGAIPSQDVPASYPISRGGMKSLLEERWHYIRNGDGREELYDFRSDPLEQRDLSGTAEGRRTIERRRGSLEAIVGKSRAKT